MERKKTNETWVIALAGTLALLVLTMDLVVPLGVSGGVPYVAVVLVLLWSRHPKRLLYAAAICTLLTGLGWWGSPLGGETWKVLPNRSLAVFAIWATAMIGYQHKQAEALLRRSEHELRIITDNVAGRIAYINSDHRYAFVNLKYSEFYGVPRHQIVGKHLSDILGRELYQRARPHLQEALAGKQTFWEVNTPNRDGEDTWSLVNLVPDTTKSKKTNGVFVLITDITRRLLVEEERDKLLAQEKEMRTGAEASRKQIANVLERVSDAFVALDHQWRYTFVNKKATKIFNRSQEDLIGKNIWEEFPEGVGQPFHAAYHEAMEKQTFIYLEDYYKPWDRWFENRIYPSKDGLSIFFHDITDRKQAEETLRLVRTAMDYAFDAMIITSDDTNQAGPTIEYVNTAFTEMTGYTAQEAIGKPLWMLLDPQSDKTLRKQVLKKLKQGQSFIGEIPNCRKDRSPFISEWRVDAVRNTDGQTTHWVSIQRDITQRLEMEKNNRQHLEKLAHTARLAMMGELASGLAHELNQPLTTIRTYSDASLRLMKSGQWDKQELMTAMTESSSECQRASQIIHRLRSLARKREPQRSPTQVNQLIEDAFGLIEHEARAKGISLQRALLDTLPSVQADHIQVEQVILNLLHNGIEAMHHNSSTGTGMIARTRVINENTAIEVSIEDNGPGIPRDKIDEIFNQFYTTKEEGMGLGLSISRSIIEAHRGRLWAEAKPAGGMVFKFTLPIE